MGSPFLLSFLSCWFLAPLWPPLVLSASAICLSWFTLQIHCVAWGLTHSCYFSPHTAKLQRKNSCWYPGDTKHMFQTLILSSPSIVTSIAWNQSLGADSTPKGAVPVLPSGIRITRKNHSMQNQWVYLKMSILFWLEHHVLQIIMELIWFILLWKTHIRGVQGTGPWETASLSLSVSFKSHLFLYFPGNLWSM